jgi:hypothetical protein
MSYSGNGAHTHTHTLNDACTQTLLTHSETKIYIHRKLPEDTQEPPDSEGDDNQNSDMDDDNTTNIDMDTFKPSVLLSSLMTTNNRNSNDQTPQRLTPDISLQTPPTTTQLRQQKTPMKPRPPPMKRTHKNTTRDATTLTNDKRTTSIQTPTTTPSDEIGLCDVEVRPGVSILRSRTAPGKRQAKEALADDSNMTSRPPPRKTPCYRCLCTWIGSTTTTDTKKAPWQTGSE